MSCIHFVAVLEYKVGDFGQIRYYLAPKIEDDDTQPNGEEMAENN